jgi:2-amino-4-hydroxy-6-hydroxymethyldihydropteridine diphosphokinase
VPEAEALLGFGGNLADPIAAIEAALNGLQAAKVRIVARSRFYRTPPWGPVPQPPYVNLCALAHTTRGPRDLLALTQSLEAKGGRERSVRFGPRTLDIDILTYADLRMDAPDLTLPHPRLTERAFVLVPLAEIAPDFVVNGRAVRDWAAEADRSGIEPIESRYRPRTRT